MEKTLILIKPDAVEKNIIGKVLSFYEEKGLKIVALRMEHITRALAEQHYIEHKGRDYYEELLEFITKGPLCTAIIEGENAIARVREINGATDPSKQREGTIRKAFAKNKTENCVHASDSKDSAKREIVLWFPNYN